MYLFLPDPTESFGSFSLNQEFPNLFSPKEKIGVTPGPKLTKLYTMNFLKNDICKLLIKFLTTSFSTYIQFLDECAVKIVSLKSRTENASF